jgi:hypothetical protein
MRGTNAGAVPECRDYADHTAAGKAWDKKTKLSNRDRSYEENSGGNRNEACKFVYKVSAAQRSIGVARLVA